MREIRLPEAIAVGAVWPLVAISESAARVSPPADQVLAGCTAPTYATDRLLCSDPVLLALDAEWARLRARAEAAGHVTRAAQRAQIDWFRQRRLCAFGEDQRAFAEAAYRERIAQLQRLAAG
jgi:uncharacterized protein